MMQLPPHGGCTNRSTSAEINNPSPTQLHLGFLSRQLDLAHLAGAKITTSRIGGPLVLPVANASPREIESATEGLRRITCCVQCGGPMYLVADIQATYSHAFERRVLLFCCFAALKSGPGPVAAAPSCASCHSSVSACWRVARVLLQTPRRLKPVHDVQPVSSYNSDRLRLSSNATAVPAATAPLKPQAPLTAPRDCDWLGSYITTKAAATTAPPAAAEAGSTNTERQRATATAEQTGQQRLHKQHTVAPVSHSGAPADPQHTAAPVPHSGAPADPQPTAVPVPHSGAPAGPQQHHIGQQMRLAEMSHTQYLAPAPSLPELTCFELEFTPALHRSNLCTANDRRLMKQDHVYRHAERLAREYEDRSADEPGYIDAFDIGGTNCATGGSVAAVYEEKYEPTPLAQRFLQRFALETSSEPLQVCRYAFGGRPLWMSPPPFDGPSIDRHVNDSYNNKHSTAPDTTVRFEEVSDVQPPLPCPNCQAPRVFELQLMPALLTLLGEKKGTAIVRRPGREEAYDFAEFNQWSVVAVYSCSNDCGAVEFDQAASTSFEPGIPATTSKKLLVREEVVLTAPIV